MKKCPYCAEEIQEEAIKCRYCGEWLEQEEQIRAESKNSVKKDFKREPERHEKDEISEGQKEKIEISSRTGEGPSLSTKWLEFWTYVRLPISILGCTIWAVTALLKSEGILIFIFYVIFIILYSVIFTSFINKKLRGWRLNWIIIFLEPLIYLLINIPENGEQKITFYTIVFGLIIWVFTNTIYFKKRKILFS